MLPRTRHSGEDLNKTWYELLAAFLKDLCDDTNPYLYRAAEIETLCLPAADQGDLRTGAVNKFINRWRYSTTELTKGLEHQLVARVVLERVRSRLTSCTTS